MTNYIMKETEKIHELLGYEKIKIIQDESMFSFSLDSILLANFIDTKGAKKIIDLGTGNAPIPLFLTLKTDALIYGVEIQEDVYSLAKRSVLMNGFAEQINIINRDYKNIYQELGANSFDIVSCNPPYFEVDKSIKNKNDYLTIARHEVKSSYKDAIIEAKKLLKDGGKLYLVHRVSRIPEILRTLEEHNFGIRRIQIVYPKVSKEAIFFLVEAKKNKKSDLKIIDPIYSYDENNEYTKEVLKIFNFRKE